MIKPDIKGKSIQTILNWYYKDLIWVNRRYQRKLVWNIEEKKSFIDSLLSGIPIPSILLAKSKKDDRYEIIDGLQRLNALISFLRGEFSVKIEDEERWFDRSVNSRLMEDTESDYCYEQKEPKMQRCLCEDFLDYEIPVIISDADDNMIDEIFRRINSSGQKLSNQEIRQSSSCDSFADLVRITSSEIRGEHAYNDIIALADMPKISIGNRGLDYGIDMNRVFWRRHDIITEKNIRKSIDEELIAKVIIEFFSKDTVNPNQGDLTKAYTADSDENKLLCEAIDKYGKIRFVDDLKEIIDKIDEHILSANTTFSKLCYYSSDKGNISGKNDMFRFLLVNLVEMKQLGYTIDVDERFVEFLKDIGNGTLRSFQDGDVNKDKWHNLKDTTEARLRQVLSFCSEEKTEDDIEIKKRLKESVIEQQMTEYKIGIIEVKRNVNKLSAKKIEEIVRTLVAMRNTDSKKEGLIIVGVADSYDQAKNWKKVYGESFSVVEQHPIVGVENEAVSAYGDLDTYYQAIKDTIKRQPISKRMRDEVLQGYRLCNFSTARKQLLIFRCRAKPNEQELYDGIAYVRNGNSTEKMI